jgi:hypothetical protein
VDIDDLSRPDEAPIRLTHRYVVGPASAGAVWRDHVVTNRTKVLLPPIVVCLLLAALIYYPGYDEHYSFLTRAVGATIWAVVTVLLVWTPLLAFACWRTTRNLRIRWYDGAVLESGFGPDAFVTRSPKIARRIRYDAVKSIKVSRKHVHIYMLGSIVALIWPRALFPDEDIARIRAASHSSQPCRGR